ncbi:MAG: PhoH family protein [Pedobacter sp.]|nr:MAG: PhoH family protein [Pedobacter sp.]
MVKRANNTKANSKKIFVLDTSVILYDHDALNNFKEHDVVIPIQVLEELDNFKNGNDNRNFEARSFIRLIDELSKKQLINEWIDLPGAESGRFRIAVTEKKTGTDAEKILGSEKTDHRILNTALFLKEERAGNKVILVSKDICLRLKAKALGLQAEDYETGKIKNAADLYSGITEIKGLNESLFSRLKNDKVIPAEGIQTDGHNQFYILRSGRKQASAFHYAPHNSLEFISRLSAMNIQPRNQEQYCALHALMNPAIKLVTLQGNAGTGKTLLALASALEQRKDFRQIFVTRPVIPLSNQDIGYLPGDIKSKIDPYMSPIWDNLKFIKEQFSKEDDMRGKIEGMVESEKITITPLAFIRGRTLAKIFFIVDEAQNLTPHEVKTIISRAGEDTKIVFTGDIYQIDTPYLDAESNGLSYLIENAKSHPLYAHITLQKGERSELANLANELL